MRRFQARILILPSDETPLIIYRDMSGKEISKRRLAFKDGTRLAKFRLWMPGGHFDIKFLYLLIGYAGHTAPGNE